MNGSASHNGWRVGAAVAVFETMLDHTGVEESAIRSLNAMKVFAF